MQKPQGVVSRFKHIATQLFRRIPGTFSNGPSDYCRASGHLRLTVEKFINRAVLNHPQRSHLNVINYIIKIAPESLKSTDVVVFRITV